MQRILTTRQRVVKIFVLLKSNALFNAFLREEGGTRMRDGRSLRDPHFFACFITTAFPKLRTLPQSPTATCSTKNAMRSLERNQRFLSLPGGSQGRLRLPFMGRGRLRRHLITRRCRELPLRGSHRSRRLWVVGTLRCGCLAARQGIGRLRRRLWVVSSRGDSRIARLRVGDAGRS